MGPRQIRVCWRGIQYIYQLYLTAPALYVVSQTYQIVAFPVESCRQHIAAASAFQFLVASRPLALLGTSPNRGVIHTVT